MQVEEHRLLVQDVQIAGDVAKLLLLPEMSASFAYKEGQYLNLLLPSGHSRAYSFASPYREGGVIELHVRLHENGRFSNLLKNQLKKGDRLTASGPFGDCLWQTPTRVDAPILMLATGTGIAPLKALLEAELPKRAAPISLYWGGRVLEDLYLQAYFESLQKLHDHFKFVPVLSGEIPTPPACKGYVQDLAAWHHPDLSHSHVYACGAPRMIGAARAVLTHDCALPPDNFHADAFVPAWEAKPADTPLSGEGYMVELSVSAGANPGKALRLRGGQSLMQALSHAGLIHGVCGGRQSCGTCRVTIEAAQWGELPPPSRSEQRLLKTLPQSGAHDRLACQLPVTSALRGMEIFIPDDPVNRMKRHMAQS